MQGLPTNSNTAVRCLLLPFIEWRGRGLQPCTYFSLHIIRQYYPYNDSEKDFIIATSSPSFSHMWWVNWRRGDRNSPTHDNSHLCLHTILWLDGAEPRVEALQHTLYNFASVHMFADNSNRLIFSVIDCLIQVRWPRNATTGHMQPHATLVANSISHRILLPSSYRSLRHVRSPNVIQYIKQGTRCTPGFLSISLSFLPLLSLSRH